MRLIQLIRIYSSLLSCMLLFTGLSCTNDDHNMAISGGQSYFSSYGFSIQFPDNWAIIENHEANEISAWNIQKMGHGIPLENINIYFRKQIGPRTLEEVLTIDSLDNLALKRKMGAWYDTFFSPSIVEETDTIISGHNAHRTITIDSPPGSDLEITALGYRIIWDNYDIEIVCSAATDSFQIYLNLFEDVVRSISFADDSAKG